MTIEQEVEKVVKSLTKLADGVDRRIRRNKAIKRKAARIVEAAMYLNAPRGTETVVRKGKTIAPGALRRSIRLLPFRKSNDVFVGPDHKVAPHAALVEFGYVHWKDKKFKQGKHFVKKTYEQTKGLVLESLKQSARKEFEKYGQEFKIDG